MILRPYGIVLEGRLEVGLEAIFENGRVQEIRPHTGVPSPWVLSSAFVNHHSHLEYRGLQGVITAREYWPWIREITRLKSSQKVEDVAADALRAATENVAAGVSSIAEHSDRPVAGEALTTAGLDGLIFQEVITFFEALDPAEKLASIEVGAESQRRTGFPVYLSPHAPYTVDEWTLGTLVATGYPLSIHVAETELESEFFRDGAGPIAEMYREFGLQPRTVGVGVVPYLGSLGYLRDGVQFVHACAVDDADIEAMARSAVAVAHCPRSNRALGCPTAPVRRMLEAGVRVGLGLDSPASSGPIDVFAEMREAIASSHRLHEPIAPEAVWRMATEPLPWSPQRSEWIAIHIPDAHHTLDLIERGMPELVERVGGTGSGSAAGLQNPLC